MHKKLSVSHLNWAVSWICVNWEPSKQTSKRIWICLALLSPDYSKIWCSVPWGVQTGSPEHGATKIIATLGKKTCKIAVGSFWPLCTNTSVTLWGQKRGEVVWSPPDSPPPHFPRRLSKSESCCKAFQLGQTGIFPTERLLLSLFPSLWVSLAFADARRRGSGCAHSAPAPRALKWGTQKHPKWHRETLTPSRATFSTNSSVSLLWQSFRLREKVWGFNLS